MKEKNKIRMSFKFNKENFDINKIKNSVFEFFLNHSEIIFMLFFVITVSLSGFLIYKYIYSSSWSEERKNIYLQELKKGEIEFKSDEFNEVVKKVKDRAALYEQEKTSTGRDIFGIEQ